MRMVLEKGYKEERRVKVMKKFLLVLLVISVLSLIGCWGNKDIFDNISPSSNIWTYAEV